MPELTYWIVEHPPTDAHPGAVLTFTDPTSQHPGEQPLQMPCWLFGCTCFRTYPARRAGSAAAYVALTNAALTYREHAQTAAGATNTATATNGPAEPHNGSQSDSGQDVSASGSAGGCIESGPHIDRGSGRRAS